MQLLEIEFRGRRRGVFANPQEYPLTPDHIVVVQADRGIDIGRVNLLPDQLRPDMLNGEHTENGDQGENGESGNNGINGDEPSPQAPTEAILRLANEEDLQRDAENREYETEAKTFFLEQVKELELEMKLVEVECQLDRRKLTFYFTADGRVDFRELVKILAQKFHTRIDLRQIGARDESKRLGGIGICGRELCCSSWIREFKPVTTSMMKDQNMILNPQKNTGPCGKLRCCLRYEVDQYKELNLLFPQVNTEVKGPRGKGRVTKFSYNWEHIGIEWEDGTKYSYGEEHLKVCTNWDPETKDKNFVLQFKSDPSIAEQHKEEKEGDLVARGEPVHEGEPKVSVRSRPKKHGGTDDDETCSCGKEKGQGDGSGKGAVQPGIQPKHAPRDKQGSHAQQQPQQAADAAEQDTATDRDKQQQPSQKPQRGRGRGGRSRGRGGRGNRGQRQSGGGGDTSSSGAKKHSDGSSSDVDESQNRSPRSHRSRGGRNRSKGRPGRQPKQRNQGEASGSSSGGQKDHGPSSQSNKKRNRPPRGHSRGPNRKRDKD